MSIPRLSDFIQRAGILASQVTRSAFSRKWRRDAYYLSKYGDIDSFHKNFTGNEEAVAMGQSPAKQARIADMIPGERILEVGAAEGLLALTLALRKASVKAIELTPARYNKANEIKDLWSGLGIKVDNCQFYLGDIFDNKHLFDDVDTLVASRVIYYFQKDIELFMAMAASSVRYVCLVGNPKTQAKYRQGIETHAGRYAYYSTIEGMSDLLNRYGYSVIQTDDHEDPVVVGEKRRPPTTTTGAWWRASCSTEPASGPRSSAGSCRTT